MRCFISCPKIFNFLCSGPLLPWFILVSECIARATTAGISVRLRSCGPGQLQSGTFLQPSPFSIEQKFTSLLPSFPALPLLTSIPFWTLIARRLRTWLPEDLLVQLAPRAALNKKKKKKIEMYYTSETFPCFDCQWRPQLERFAVFHECHSTADFL